MAYDPLLSDFAARDMQAFALALSEGSAEEALQVLKEIPTELAVPAIARMPLSRINALLDTHALTVRGWLELATFEGAMALVSRLSRERAVSMVSALANQELRRRLLRFLRYPSHCVGGIVPGTTLQFAPDTSVERVLAELRSQNRGREIAALVLDAQGRYRGKLDYWRLLVEAPTVAPVGDYCLTVMPLHPETPLTEARNLPQWDNHNWLPVVDHERQVLGSVSRAQLSGASDRAANQLGEGVLDLGSQLFRVAGNLLTRLLGVRST